MMTATEHPLVQDYLARLREASRTLPLDQARELEADITEHLDAGLGADPGEAAVRDAIDRLGSPAEVVGEAGGISPAPAISPGSGPGPDASARSYASPVGAIACLVAAELFSVIVFVSVPLWVVGIILLVRATVWTEREKLLGFLGLGTGLFVSFAVLGLGLVAARTDSGGCVEIATEAGPVSTPCEPTSGGTGVAGVVILTLLVGYVLFQGYTIWRLARAMRQA